MVAKRAGTRRGGCVPMREIRGSPLAVAVMVVMVVVVVVVLKPRAAVVLT